MDKPLRMVESRRARRGVHEEAAMTKVLRCRDLGTNCPKEIRAETEQELMKLAAEHAEKDHGIAASSIPPSILAMVKAAIRNE
jgi:predicted small metal-binding protein